jgi:hypothetical protein
METWIEADDKRVIELVTLRRNCVADPRYHTELPLCGLRKYVFCSEIVDEMNVDKTPWAPWECSMYIVPLEKVEVENGL